MAKAWKIAPGGKAEAWELCRDQGCIVIGWEPIGDYRNYQSKDDIEKALKRKCRSWKIGKGPRSAQSIWRFANTVQQEDVVIANDGRRWIKGIGVIKSDYVQPNAPSNPSLDEGYPNARRVSWRITEPIELRPYFFVQDTVWPLEPSQCEEIRAAYLKKSPGLKGTLAELFGELVPHSDFDESTEQKIFSDDSDIEGLRNEYLATKPKRSRRLRNKAFRLAKGRCRVCQRDFSKVLEGRGQRVLQVHHCHQLSTRDVPSVTSLNDLVVVCANCHLLLHLDYHESLTVDQLRILLKNEHYLHG